MVDVVLQPPPRPVPWSLRLVVVLGGALSVVAWLLLAVGLLFAAVFVPLAAPLFDDPFAGPVSNLTAKVVAVERTNVKVNKSSVRAVTFEWPAGDRPRRAISYTLDDTPEVGSEVPIEAAHGPDAPARIRGMSTHQLPSGLRLILLLPCGAGAFLMWTLLRGWRRARLLQNGEVAQGRLVASKATNTTINNHRVYALTFAFTDVRQRERQVVVRTHQVAEVTDQPSETLVYDPTGTAAVLLDDLPGRPRVDEHGQFQSARIGQLVSVLVPPTVGLLFVQVALWVVDAMA